MINKPFIHIQDLVKTYSIEGIPSVILNTISFSVNVGDLLAIVGASGSGKSTLMNIIGLLDKADKGTYLLANKNVANLSQDEAADLRNQTIGFVFQQFNLLPRFTVLQNVSLPLTYREQTATEIKERAMQALERVGMKAYAKHRPLQLSGGQQQRVAIARALVTEPEMILADEPTGSLDSHTGSEVMNLFLSLNAEGRTIILVTHDKEIAACCKRCIRLLDGNIISNEKAVLENSA